MKRVILAIGLCLALTGCYHNGCIIQSACLIPITHGVGSQP